MNSPNLIKDTLNNLLGGGSLSEDESGIIMGLIMDGKVSPAQIGALLIAMRLKGETVEEIAGFARVMRDRAVQIKTKHTVLVDTCGTGGDGLNTFNISTAAALVTAGCGVPVAKHGNRSVSSQCGSADVLEALGVNIDLDPDDVGVCLDQLGIAFLFAPLLHGALKHASEPRREIGVRTIFNLLGPLANPARANNQVLGVFNKELVPKIAGVLSRLGTRKSYVLNGALNTDEITPIGPALIYEVSDRGIEGFELDPKAFGIERCELIDLKGGTSADNGLIIRELLGGKKGPHRDAVVLNTSLALMASEFAQDMDQGIEMAAYSIDSGKASKKLQELVEFTSSINSRKEAI